MKRSEQIVLTTLFLTAVSSYACRAQDIMVSARQKDSLQEHHSSVMTNRHRHFFSFLHRHTQSAQTTPATTNVPRHTGGFGMSLRTSASAHS